LSSSRITLFITIAPRRRGRLLRSARNVNRFSVIRVEAAATYAENSARLKAAGMQEILGVGAVSAPMLQAAWLDHCPLSQTTVVGQDWLFRPQPSHFGHFLRPLPANFGDALVYLPYLNRPDLLDRAIRSVPATIQILLTDH